MPKNPQVINHTRPWNYQDFLDRSLTFSKTRTWFAKPSSTNPLICSLYGWTNSGIDTLTCLNCKKKLIHEKGKVINNTKNTKYLYL